MVTFSKWDPNTGEYEYFESESSRPGMNDDLPVPVLPSPTDLGVPSTEVGRPLPADALPVGSGEFAVGLITYPATVQPLSGGALSKRDSLIYTGVGTLLGAALVCLLIRKWR